MTGVADLLDAWEAAGQEIGPARGAALAHRLGLLPDEWAATIGSCAAALAAAHRQLFGDTLAITLDCAGCGELLDVPLDLLRLPAAADSAEVTTSVGIVVVHALTTADLLAAATSPQPQQALLAATVPGTDPDGLNPADLDLIDAVAEHLAGPAAMLIRAECPCCGAEASAGLELGGLVWERLTRWAERRFVEVAALARAYGWTEAEVFALSPSRRARYLELAGS